MSQTQVGDFKSTNPHALAVILEASETRSIIAAGDIFDIRGNLLWARNQPVSPELQRRLMDRALKHPIETSLMAEDGVQPATLRDAVTSLLDAGGALTPLLTPQAAVLRRGAAAVHLHPVVQLLLSAAQTARPAMFAHAIDAMAVAGALVAATGSGGDDEIARAMTAGLLHDIGEMYVAPEFGEADASSALDIETYRQLVVHPHVGQLLLKQLTDYPADVVRAVAEHHERLDGSGYPHRLHDAQLSSMGRLLAVTEEALAALRMPGATLHHASVALRVVPHEFDVHLAGPLASAAHALPPMAARRSIDDLRQRLSRLDTALAKAPERIRDALPDPCGDALQQTAGLVLALVERLRHGWNESGLWSMDTISADNLAEAEAAQDALRARLLEIGRVARLSAVQVTEVDRICVDRICEILVEALVRPA